MRLIGYIRVSSVGQVDGYGLEAQERAIREWAALYGHTVARVVADEGVSGTREAADRPGLTAALEAIQPPPDSREADGVIVARLDRLARSLTVQEAILGMVWKAEAAVFSADTGEVPQDDDDDPMRTAIRQIMGVMAQMDRAMTVKKLRDGKKVKRSEGGKTDGRYPYGYRAEGHGRERVAVPDEAEQQVITLMRELRANGLSLRAVAAELDDQGILTRDGKLWSAQAVKNVLDRTV